MASVEMGAAEGSAETGGDSTGFLSPKGVREGTHWTMQEKVGLDAMGRRTMRAGLGAVEREAANEVEDVAGYKVDMKGSSWVDNADRALRRVRTSADKGTIAVGAAAGNMAVEVDGDADADGDRDVDSGDRWVAYEDVEKGQLPDGGFHAVAGHCGEELPAEQVHERCSSRARKPRGLGLEAVAPGPIVSVDLPTSRSGG